MTSYPPPYPTEKSGYPDAQQPPPMMNYPAGYQPVPTGPPQGGVYYAPQPGQMGQPQQPQVYVTQPPVIIATTQPPQSFVLHICLACFTLWCCGCVIGLIAFIVAMIAQSSSTSDRNSARTLGRVSLGLSIFGIVIGTICLIVFIVRVVLTVSAVRENCEYVVDGSCYRKRSLMMLGETCFNGYAHESYCYTEKFTL